jgi:hypothetical protein
MMQIPGFPLVLLLALVLAGCGTSRVIIATGTTIGLKATPGDGSTRPPQVTFGYKRAEAGIVPTRGEAVKSGEADAFSTLAAFHFETQFFGRTELDSFIGTGAAAVNIQAQSEFQDQIRQAARAASFRSNNRAQLEAVERITETYGRIADARKRDEIRARAQALGLVPTGTTDAAFRDGKLQDVAVGGLRPITDKLTELENFMASVVLK